MLKKKERVRPVFNRKFTALNVYIKKEKKAENNFAIHQSQEIRGISLVVQWLGLSAFIAAAWVRTLVGELRSYKPWVAPPPKKVEKTAK